MLYTVQLQGTTRAVKHQLPVRKSHSNHTTADQQCLSVAGMSAAAQDVEPILHVLDLQSLGFHLSCIDFLLVYKGLWLHMAITVPALPAFCLLLVDTCWQPCRSNSGHQQQLAVVCL